jgi:hypothetical protein
LAVNDAGAQILRQRIQQRKEAQKKQEEQRNTGRDPLRREPAVRNQPRLPAKEPAESGSVGQWMAYLEQLAPAEAAGYAGIAVEQVTAGTTAVEYWCGELARFEEYEQRRGQVLLVTDRLLAAKARADALLDRAIAARVGFAKLEANDARRAGLSNYLRTTSALIDLSGRLRYLLFDALNFAADEVAIDPLEYNRMLDLLVQYKSGIGANVVAVALIDPPASETDAVAVSAVAKLKILNLIADTGQYELVPELARLIKDPRTQPRIILAAADAVRRLGISQEARPGQDPTLPAPAITARELLSVLGKLDRRRMTPGERQSCEELLAWLDEPAKSGLVGDTFRLGNMELRPGDWLLMRNPSPYNLFTELSPGLFTHVGVVAVEEGRDGQRRMVIVDMPERGPEMPATNVETFVQRTRNFVFLRHPDAEVARAMGQAAAATIGNVTEFDLNFRTDRILSLKGQPLRGKKVHTYCAGFLYLCALQTDRLRAEFFPIPEGPAGGYTQENLAKFGFTFGENFISPTGAFFSPALELVGRREPMYDPRREIEEAVFDHFATSLLDKQVTPSPDVFQVLRLKVAEYSKTSEALKRALASAVGVAEEMDLVAAAKAKALVETLDEVAFGASAEFLSARDAIMSGALPPSERPTPEAQANVAKYRTRHAELAKRWDAEKLSPRGLRVELVRYYTEQGKREIERRFFRMGNEGMGDGE